MAGVYAVSRKSLVFVGCFFVVATSVGLRACRTKLPLLVAIPPLDLIRQIGARGDTHEASSLQWGLELDP